MQKQTFLSIFIVQNVVMFFVLLWKKNAVILKRIAGYSEAYFYVMVVRLDLNFCGFDRVACIASTCPRGVASGVNSESEPIPSC